eukprot:GHVS01045530.1.p1 GENE.GHVS01045530.1~~GHVS01045530.1.p1  ORF type:complete len:938 (+),score=125.26 GHVS01045530.1:382-3195(+)
MDMEEAVATGIEEGADMEREVVKADMEREGMGGDVVPLEGGQEIEVVTNLFQFEIKSADSANIVAERKIWRFDVEVEKALEKDIIKGQGEEDRSPKQVDENTEEGDERTQSSGKRRARAGDDGGRGRRRLSPDDKKADDRPIGKIKRTEAVHTAVKSMCGAAITFYYDGDRILLTDRPLPKEEEDPKTQLVVQEEKKGARVRLNKFNVKIKKVCGPLNLSKETPEQTIQFIAIMMGHTMQAQGKILMHNSVYSDEADRFKPLEGSVKSLWMGCYVCPIALQRYDNGDWVKQMAIVMNPTATTAFKRQNLGDLLTKSRYSGVSQDEMGRILKGVRIETEYNQTKYRFGKILRERPADMKFTLKDGTTTNVKEYTESRYNIRIPSDDFLIETNDRNRPSHLCASTVTVESQKVTCDDRDKPGMVKQMSMPPHVRLAKTGECRQELVEYFKFLQVEPNGMRVKGKGLSVPNVSIGHAKFQFRKGRWFINSVAEPAAPVKWAVLLFHECHDETSREYKELRMSCKEYIRSMRELLVELQKISWPEPLKWLCADVGGREMERNVEDAFRKAREAEAEFVFVFLPRKDTSWNSIYAQVKDQYLHSQCVDSSKDYVTRYADDRSRSSRRRQQELMVLKMNGKLGGVNQKIDNHPDSVLSKYFPDASRVMVVGVDVCHPTGAVIGNLQGRGEKVGSVSAVVGNNAEFWKFPHKSIRLLGPREEVFDLREDLITIIKQRVKAQMGGGEIPDTFLYIRDGVAEGQFEQVIRKEVTAFTTACAELAPGRRPPRVLCIVVQKRHSHRYYTADGGKLPPGVYIDDELRAIGQYYNFWLNSHNAIQGTGIPARIFVIRNDLGIPEEGPALPSLCYELCCTYARAPLPVSYPSPAYYAHLAADVGMRTQMRHIYEKMEGVAQGMSLVDPVEDDRVLADKMRQLQLQDSFFYL